MLWHYYRVRCNQLCVKGQVCNQWKINVKTDMFTHYKATMYCVTKASICMSARNL